MPVPFAVRGSLFYIPLIFAVSKVTELWSARHPAAISEFTLPVLVCPVHLGEKFSDMAANQPVDPEILCTGLKLKDAVVQEGCPTLSSFATFQQIGKEDRGLGMLGALMFWYAFAFHYYVGIPKVNWQKPTSMSGVIFNFALRDMDFYIYKTYVLVRNVIFISKHDLLEVYCVFVW